MLEPGETHKVQFEITPEQLKFYNSSLIYDWEPGEFLIHIGSSSADTKHQKVVWKK